ncbi:hypothetical protein, conserved [Trypanosoma brucei brucei TREU927]|uniref:Kinetoplastid kinetochore protein 6 n=1 Tax=Trypanosoma brucei brucei (strain 927/4 GUTat10.1) TaxID=185431 RepID=Q585C6_TRYB2|nr:hypothetical protein, conserved [Trypanosoma brucei brucei TREU927]AAX80376.1 hypothetical protein, conserved [Trypanosoma brucei]AAZ11684.1 hypothetical protein, conserved [Trypanosoma brucei brucei TREU927]
MHSILPYTLDPERMTGCRKMNTINPYDASVTGPESSARDLDVIRNHLLQEWDRRTTSTVLFNPAAEIDIRSWDLSWTERESHWEENVAQCISPEEVEGLLPAKWFGYNTSSDVDETLARVCKLCTALVDKFVELSKGDNANQSTAKWRQHQAMLARISAVVELLEEAVGETLSMYDLRDPQTVRCLWERMDDEDRRKVASVLGAR